MRLDQIASLAVDQVIGRLIRRALVLLAAFVFAIVAICYFCGAGQTALTVNYGAVVALAVMGGVFTVLAGGCLLAWYATGRRKPASGAPALANPRNAQLVMLVEALMLGYSLARRSDRAR